MISTVGEAIFLEGGASMHAYGIDGAVSAISRHWDIATSICSKYFFTAEIGRYKDNYLETLTLNPGWSPYQQLNGQNSILDSSELFNIGGLVANI